MMRRPPTDSRRAYTYGDAIMLDDTLVARYTRTEGRSVVVALASDKLRFSPCGIGAVGRPLATFASLQAALRCIEDSAAKIETLLGAP